ncbi:hypothetical protein [Streptomyces lydicamycinicus]|uniref:hypothetical protein n=1 Tax=Streptomyces lydicamycinicus TaxID=1546107 RepID=UPI003C303E81
MNTTNGTNRAGPAARYQSAVDCPGSDPAFIELDLRNRPSARPVDQTDSREQAALMRAFTDANTALTAAQPGLGTAATAVADTFQQARTTIEAAERFVVARSSQQAQERVGELRARHAEDGPESLRRRPVLWRRLLWPTLVACVAFDTMFIGTLMQRFFGLGETEVGYYLAYLPGFGVAVCLLAAGSLLAESVFRRRTRTARTLERTRRGPVAALREALWPRSPRTERRKAGELPWPNAAGPVLFTLAILTMVGIWARMRAAGAVREHVDLAPDQSAVVILTLVLSTAAIVVKVLAHNPCADSDREARRDVTDAEQQGRKLLGAARRSLVAHTETWWRLRSTVEAAASEAHRTLDEACIRIVEERARTGVAGSYDLPLTAPAWPYPAVARNGARLPTGDRAPAHPTPPRARLELLDHVYTVLVRYGPDQLEDRLNGIAGDLNAQFRASPGQPVEQAGPTRSDEDEGDQAPEGAPAAAEDVRAPEEDRSEEDRAPEEEDRASEEEGRAPEEPAAPSQAPDPDQPPGEEQAAGESTAEPRDAGPDNRPSGDEGSAS